MRVGAGPLAAKEFEDVLKAIQDHKVETNIGDVLRLPRQSPSPAESRIHLAVPGRVH
jgi:hypothetical protein